MVKKINLTDTSTSKQADSTSITEKTDIGPLLDLMGQMDWKLWEIYKTCKRFEKLFEADQVNIEE